MEAAEEAARRTIGAFESVFKKMESRLEIHGAVSWGSLDVIRLASQQARASRASADDDTDPVEDGDVHDSANSDDPGSPKSPTQTSQTPVDHRYQVTVCGRR